MNIKMEYTDGVWVVAKPSKSIEVAKGQPQTIAPNYSDRVLSDRELAAPIIAEIEMLTNQICRKKLK